MMFTTRSFRMLALASCLALTVSACGTKSERFETDRYEGNLKIGNPYNIDGQTYKPHYDPNYDETGVASWYGPGFHGRSTANGERFDQHAMTAAHRTLPLPSMVKVTNLENGKSTIVKVNDRGPFKKDRIIDLSKAAATKIEMMGKGTAEVRVEYLEAESKKLIADLIQAGKLTAKAETLHMMAMNDIAASAAKAPAAATVAAVAAVPEEKPSKMAGFFGKLNPFSDAEASEPKDTPNTAPAQLEEVESVENIDASQGTAFAAPNRAEANYMPTKPVASRDLTAPTEALINPPAEMESLPEPQVTAEPQMVAASPLPSSSEPEMQAREAEAQVALLNPQAGSSEPVQTVNEPVQVAAMGAGYYIQAGSFAQAQNAHILAEKLASVGEATVKPVEVNGRTLYRVRLGPIADNSSAHQALNSVQDLGVRDARVIQD